MAINFPATAGQATDGTFTYTVAGITYAWNGSSWAAAGAGASATNRSLFSVTSNSPSGGGSLIYDQNSGGFTYTPPDLSGYVTSEADTLATVTGRGASTSTALTLSSAGEALVLNGNNSRITVNGGNASGEIQVQHQGNARVTLNGTNGITTSSGIGLSLGNYGTNLWRAEIDGTSGNIVTGGSLTAGSMVVGGLTYPTTNGTSGYVLTSDGTGNVTWQTTGSRSTAVVTVNIANEAVSNTSFTTPKTYALLKVSTSHAAWVTLYSDTGSRTADASRGINVDPLPGSGVLSEVITTGNQVQLITPGTVCFNSAGTGTTYAKIVNKSGSTANITVTLTYVVLES